MKSRICKCCGEPIPAQPEGPSDTANLCPACACGAGAAEESVFLEPETSVTSSELGQSPHGTDGTPMGRSGVTFDRMSEQALFLLVEDSEDDVVLLRRAFLKGKVLNPLHVVRSGGEAILYLSGSGPYANRAEYPLPALVLLDLKMPGMDGFEVLKWIRSQPGFGTLRVVVLTTSGQVEDVNRAYRLGANSFLVKPVEFERFVEMTKALKGYWIWMNETPEAERPAPPSSQPQRRPGNGKKG